MSPIINQPQPDGGDGAQDRDQRREPTEAEFWAAAAAALARMRAWRADGGAS